MAGHVRDVRPDANLRDGVMDSEDFVSKQVFVLNQLGLHARPAARLAQAAQQFISSVSMHCRDRVIDAKSILDILALAAGPGSEIELRARGEDAQAAVDHLAGLFLKRFGEDR